MADQDIAGQWATFSPERRQTLLQKMTPEQKKYLRTQLESSAATAAPVASTVPASPGTLKQRAEAFMAPRSIDSAHPNVSVSLPGMPAVSSKVIEQLPNVGRGMLRGAATLLRHPIDTLVGGAGMPFVAAGTTPEGYPAYSYTGTDADRANIEAQKSAQGEVAEQVEQAKEQPGYTLGQALGQAAVTHGITKLAGVGELRAKAGQAVRNFSQENLGVGPEFTEKTAERYGKRATTADTKNEAITKRNAEASAKAQAKTAAQLEEEKAERLKVMKGNREATQKHEQQRQEVREHNEGVLREDRNRAAAQQKHDAAAGELDERIKQAGVKAKANNDSLWNKWREKVKGQETDSAPIAEAVKAQRSVMDPEDVAEFRKVLKESEPGTEDMEESERERGDIAQGQFSKPFEKLSDAEKAHVNRVLESMGFDPDAIEQSSAAIPADRLHVWKTQLEQAVRKATRGNVRRGIGQVLDRVRAAEDQVSANAGAEGELKAARKSHQEYSEAFVNPVRQKSSVAGKAFTENAPEFEREGRETQHLERLGKFDPEIPKLAEHVGNLREGLKALPEGPLRERFKEAPARPDATPKPKPGEATPPPKPQELVPEPEAPDLTEARRKTLQANLRKYGRVGAWVGRLVIGGGAAALSHGDISKFGTDLLIGQSGLTILTKALQSDGVLDWMSKPSAEDVKIINTLPPDQAAKMRAALTGLAQEEIRRKPSLAKKAIAPALVAFMGAQTIQAPVTSPREAKQRFDAKTSTSPDTHVFHVKEWQSHHPGEDEKRAIAEAQRQGYTVVQ